MGILSLKQKPKDIFKETGQEPQFQGQRGDIAQDFRPRIKNAQDSGNRSNRSSETFQRIQDRDGPGKECKGADSEGTGASYCSEGYDHQEL